jgi:hypothetical protein
MYDKVAWATDYALIRPYTQGGIALAAGTIALSAGYLLF